jgi:hypothetical protein
MDFDDITSSLEAIDFGSLIASPLTACVEAQAQASAATTRYIHQVGFHHDQDTNYQAKTLQFSFTMGGQRKRIVLPLISVVPLPYLQIDHIKLNFATDVSMDSGYLIGRIATTASMTEKHEQASSFKGDLKINVGIQASTSDLPLGVERLMQVLSGAVEVTQKSPEVETSYQTYPENEVTPKPPKEESSYQSSQK